MMFINDVNVFAFHWGKYVYAPNVLLYIAEYTVNECKVDKTFFKNDEYLFWTRMVRYVNRLQTTTNKGQFLAVHKFAFYGKKSIYIYVSCEQNGYYMFVYNGRYVVGCWVY